SARERYEAAENLAIEAATRAAAHMTTESAREATPALQEVSQPSDLMTFTEVWEEQAQAQATVQLRTLVCFLSDLDQQRALRDLARRYEPDLRLIFIARDDAIQDQAPRDAVDVSVLHINTRGKAADNRVFQHVQDEGRPVDAVPCRWAGEGAALVRDPTPMVHILQAMAETKLHIGRILCAARCAPETLDCCYWESWIAFERSLGLVLPNTPVAVILDETAPPAAAWLERLWSELHATTPESVLYRNGKRHVCRIRPTVLASGNGTALRMGGTYLITGGCGALGLLFARHLAETRAANLILTGRSPLDAAKRAAIEQLETGGSQVLYIQA